MTEFTIALSCFLAAHLVPALPRLRAWLIGRLGRRVYLGLYGLASLALLGWMIDAALRAPVVVLWDPAPWQWLVPIAAMPFAAILLAGGLLEPNPLSITLRHGGEPGPTAAITRHPVLWAFLIWALAHVPPNGTAVTAMLFGSMALFAAAGIPLVEMKARRRLGPDRWHELRSGTSIVPFAALLSRRARPVDGGRLVVPVGVGLALYVWFLVWGHAWLIGPAPLAVFGG